MKTLQEQFAASAGRPLSMEGRQVVQLDRLPLKSGRVSIRAARAELGHGVALKATSGSIHLSDGRRVLLLHVWFDPGLPLEVTHNIDCPDGELRVWNVYRTRHPNGDVTEDAWTGNAGMIVEPTGESSRHYRCSNGQGLFDPGFEFTIKWETETTR